MQYLQKTGMCLFILWMLISFNACKEDSEFIPDVSMIEPEFKINSIEQSLINIDTNNTDIVIENLYENYPAFMEIVGSRLWKLNKRDSPLDDNGKRAFNQWVKEPRIQHITRLVDSMQSDFSFLEKDLKAAYRYYGHYFNIDTFPDVYTYISDLRIGVFLFEEAPKKDALGLSYDMFMGSRFDYTMLAGMDPLFSEHVSRTMTTEYMVRKMMESLVNDKIAHANSSVMVDALIREGKKMYILDKLLPNYSDTIIWEYTTQDWKWVSENEWNIYSFIVSEDLLHNTDRMKYRGLMLPSPYSKGMPKEAPGRAVNYIGYKMVEAFMKRHPDVSLGELAKMTDGQEILNQGRYKPPRQ